MPDKQTELNNCNYVKTLLMILVVIYHSCVFWTGNWFVGMSVYQAPLLNYFARWLNSFHIYAFTLISGYIFLFLKYEKGKYKLFKPFLLNKVKRLLVPYIFIVTTWVLPVTVYFFKYDFKTIFHNYILAESPSQLWFLWMLFDVFIIFWLFSDFFKKYNYLGMIVAIVFYILGLAGKEIIPNIFCIWTACQYIVFFWLGFKMSQYTDIFVRKIPACAWLAANLFLCVVTQLFLRGDGVVIELLCLVMKFFMYITGALMAFTILQWAVWHFRLGESKILKFLSGKTMVIYLLHQQIIYFIISWLDGEVNPYINVIANFLFAMAGSLVIGVILLKFKLGRFLIGES